MWFADFVKNTAGFARPGEIDPALPALCHRWRVWRAQPDDDHVCQVSEDNVMPQLGRFGDVGRRACALLPLACAVFLSQSFAIAVPDASAQPPAPMAPPFVQQGEFSPLDGGAANGFGHAVAMSSDGLTAAVTAPSGVDVSGRLYILSQTTGGIWTLDAEFSGSQFGTPGTGLGEGVAVSGDGLTVAASVGLVAAGSTVRGVAVVRNVGGKWGIDATVMVPGATTLGNFGALPLALSNTGTTMVVGNAASADVLVYQRAGTWALSATLTSSVGKGIGWAVAVSAAGDRILASNGHGDVEAFAGAGNAWSAGQVLVQSDPSPPDASGVPTGSFGYAVALSADGGTAVVSDPAHNGGAGAVYVYLDNGGFVQEAELTSSAPAANDLLGFSVAVDGTGATVVAGAPLAGDGTDSRRSARVHGSERRLGRRCQRRRSARRRRRQRLQLFRSGRRHLRRLQLLAGRGTTRPVGLDRSVSLHGHRHRQARRVRWHFLLLRAAAGDDDRAHHRPPARHHQPAGHAQRHRQFVVYARRRRRDLPECWHGHPGLRSDPYTNNGIALCQTTPITLGTFSITALYSGDGGYDGSTSPVVNLQVITQPVITGVVAPAAVNVSYVTGFGGTGGTAPYTFSLSGTLPAGLSWSPAPSNLIEGVPTQANSVANVTVTMTDSSVPPAIVNRTIQITVSAGAHPPLLIITTVPSGVTGAGYGVGFQALGGDSSAHVWSLANGTTLPPTLSLASNGNLSGRLPSTPGAVTFDVQVANLSGLTPPVVQSFTILVLPAIPPTPLAPTAPVASIAGAPSASAIVTWTAPTNASDAAVTSYTVTSSPGGISVGTPTAISLGGGPIPTSAVVRGLTPGVAYTFTVTASNNAQLTSATSVPSNAIVAVAAFPANSAQFTSHSGGTFASAATPSGSVTADAVGLGTVIVADYPDSPYATLPSAQSFVDVKTLAGSAFTSVTITVCGGAAASDLEWWNANAAAWQPVAPPPIVTGTCAQFTVTAASTPNLTQLAGTPFALLASPTILLPPVAAGQLNPPAAGNSIRWAATVALSGDGKTALVGAPGAIGTAGPAAVAVLSDASGTWQVQSFIRAPALTNLAPGTVGPVFASRFADQVVLSSDGSTALVTATTSLGPGQGVRDDPQGATFVYHQTGGVWTQQAELSEPFAGTGLAYYEANVGLSSDGTTAFITQPLADRVWIYTATNGVWSNQAILTPSDPEANDGYGAAAAISADGNTLVVGAWQHQSPNPIFAGNISGTVYVYTRSGSTWTQTAELLPQAPDPLSPAIDLGYHVAVSGDGTTVFATEWGYHSLASQKGAVAVFVSRDNWTTSTQTTLLVSPDVGEDANDQFGAGIAVASGGQTLLISDQGAMVWMFVADHGGWTAHGVLRPANITFNPAIPQSDPEFGTACQVDPTTGVCYDQPGPEPIALSGDGNTLAVGAQSSNSFATDFDGYLYLYGVGSPPGEAAPVVPQYATPTVTSVSPASGAAAGGTPVTLTGTNFSKVAGATIFAFGVGNLATAVVCATATSCTAVTPAGTAGTTVDVIATVVTSSSAANPPGDQFSWTAVVSVLTLTGVMPASGAAAGGTPVTITGTGFSTAAGATMFAFGTGKLATAVVCATSTSCTAVTPAGAGGTTVDVIATVGASSSAANPPGDRFRWRAGRTRDGDDRDDDDRRKRDGESPLRMSETSR
jgi:hypothetical protein